MQETEARAPADLQGMGREHVPSRTETRDLRGHLTLGLLLPLDSQPREATSSLSALTSALIPAPGATITVYEIGAPRGGQCSEARFHILASSSPSSPNRFILVKVTGI